MSQPLPTQSGNGLVEYFSKLKRPKGILSTEFPEKGFKFYGVDVNLKSLGDWATKGARRYRAAWLWINPASPVRRLNELPHVKQTCRFGEMEDFQFCSLLCTECRELQRQHPPLGRWIGQRLSLLEFKTNPFAGLSDDLEHAAYHTRQQFLRCHSMLYSNAALSRSLADDLIDSALEGAAQAVCEILGNPPHLCRATANLMIPVEPRALGSVQVLATEDGLRNRETANAVWNGERFSSELRLLIAAETKGAHHLGFWVPLIRSETGETLPGAPTAYEKLHGSAVFKDDLPDMRSFPGALPDRWRAYIKGNLAEKLFVSLPFIARTSDTKVRRECVAVLNVNADPPDGHDWHRAYHQEWLNLATREAAKFVEPAINALRLRTVVDMASGRGTLTTDLGHLSQYLEVSARSRLIEVDDGDKGSKNR